MSGCPGDDHQEDGGGRVSADQFLAHNCANLCRQPWDTEWKWHTYPNLREDKIKSAQPSEVRKYKSRFTTLRSNHISWNYLTQHQRCRDEVGRWGWCWWAVRNMEKRFTETAHNSSPGTNDSDMQMCLLAFCFPPQPAHRRQRGTEKSLIISLSVSFIYLYADRKNSFFTKT